MSCQRQALGLLHSCSPSILPLHLFRPIWALVHPCPGGPSRLSSDPGLWVCVCVYVSSALSLPLWGSREGLRDGA